MRKRIARGGEKAMHQEKSKKRWVWLAAAVSVLLLFGAALYLLYREEIFQRDDSMPYLKSEAGISMEQPQEDTFRELEEEPSERMEEKQMPEEIVPEVKEVYLDFAGSKVQFAEAENTAVPFTLSLVSEKENGVSQVLDWFWENELFLPMLGDPWSPYMERREDAPKLHYQVGYYNNVFYDENYIYEWTPEELKIYDSEKGYLLYRIAYQSDQWYLMGNCAALIDGVLYLGQLYNGYAMPDTCFLIAYDLDNDVLLWRSEDQTCNSMNFLVWEDIILCAYGFTEERDYIYQLDRHTGRTVEKTEVKKMPDLLVEKEGRLYVHTYSYDYVFEITI
ncbi:MAG: hypothetical protein IJC59_07570 [Lachnospiraceae bacterium]|nr:hypothetical protein [Lachnospiraceae bacterium]